MIVSATVPTCNVQRARAEGTRETRNGGGQKARDLPGSVVRRNARHPQFTGNQRRECFVAVQGDEPDAPFIPRCHRRIISPRARTGSPSCSTPAETGLGEAPPSVEQDRYVARVINTRLGLRFRKITPRPRRFFAHTAGLTIYGRHGESLKNGRAVRWRLCMMIKKSCLPTQARYRLPDKVRGRERERDRDSANSP